MLDNRVVPWFPRDAGELDLVANKTLEAGVDIESDHPGFLDQGRASPCPFNSTLNCLFVLVFQVKSSLESCRSITKAYRNQCMG